MPGPVHDKNQPAGREDDPDDPGREHKHELTRDCWCHPEVRSYDYETEGLGGT